MAQRDSRIAPTEYWNRVRRRFTSRFLEFREEVTLPVPGGRSSGSPSSSLVGPWSGRLWEIRFLAPTFFFPDMQAGITTAVRLVEPTRMPAEFMPWLYAGMRPGIFTRGSAGTDRILTRYRHLREPLNGTLTGDPNLDRRWAIYPYDDALAGVFRDPEVHGILRGSSALSPDSNRHLPTLAVYGTEATITLPTDSSEDRVNGVVSAFEGFSRILDRLEQSRGAIPASRRPLVMDLLHDESGAPFPVPRFDCPWCMQATHPRFNPNADTEACEKCGRALYRLR